eukprot:519670_1
MPAPSRGKPLKHFYEVPRDLWSRKGVHVRKHVKGLTGTLIVGDDTGLIKIISCKKKKVIKTWGEQNPVKRIQKLYWAHPSVDTDDKDIQSINNSQKEFLAVLSNGDVRCYNALVGSYQTVIKQETNIQGLYVMNNPCITEDNKRMIWTANDNGDIRCWGLGYNKNTFINDYENGDLKFPNTMTLNRLPIKSKKKENENAFINLLKTESKKSKDKSINRGVLLSNWNVNTILKREQLISQGKKPKRVNSARKFDDMLRKKKYSGKIFPRSYGYNKNKVKCIKGHYLPSLFPYIAIGGDDRPVQIYDFNKQKLIFKGDHHYHWLGHKHEIIVNDVDWAKKSVNPYLCAAVTSQSEVKLYDIRTNKSSLCQKICDYSLNKVMIKSKKKIVVADANANVWEFDYLKPVKERGYAFRRFRGFIGAIKDFDIHPTRNLLASVGLGRYAVVHRFNAPHLPLMRVYLKQKLNAVLFGTVYDTQYLPKEERKDEKDVNENKDILDFVNDSESDGNDEENMDNDMNGNGDDINEEKLNEELDGYDTDELKEILNDLRNKNDNKIDEPPLKKQKLNK